MFQAFRVNFSLAPLKRSGLLIIRFDKPVDSLPQLAGRGKTGSFESLAAEDTEPDFNLIQPTGMGRCVMELHITCGAPASRLFWACGY